MTQNILGIDLGATNTFAAVIDKVTEEPVIIVNEYGKRNIPSIVAFTENQVLVGQRAQNQALVNPKGTFYGVNKIIGTSFKAVQDIASNVPFSVVEDSNRNGASAIKFNGKIFTPQEICAHLLRTVKEAAEKNLGEAVTKAILTVPAYFNDQQRQAIRDAGQIAGLEVLRVIDDPTAVALAHGMQSKKCEKIAVYHLGGGTFDVSILDVVDGCFEVLASQGNLHLGGETVDNAVVDFLIKEVYRAHNVDLKALDQRVWLSALQRIKMATEQAKKDLSSTVNYEISLPYLAMKDSTPVNFEYILKRSQLESLAQRLIEKTIDPCRKALSDAGITTSDVDEVILDGGMAYMPLVKEMTKRIFQGKSFISTSVKPDEAVAVGAAIQGRILAGND